MSDQDNPMTGEIYRRLVDMDERYEKKLDRIEEQVRMTNGRTTKLEVHVENLQSSVRSLRHHQQVHDHPATPPALPAGPSGESLSIKVSPNMWKALAAIGGGVIALLLEAARHRLTTG